MVDRTILGKRPNGELGLYISAPGKDVKTITDPQDFLFNSDFAAGAVIHASGTLTPGATANFTALPYAPIILSWGVNRTTGQQSGRTVQRADYEYEYWVPGLSEYNYERYSVAVYGPMLTCTNSSVSYPTQENFYFTNQYNARYVVLRIGS